MDHKIMGPPSELKGPASSLQETTLESIATTIEWLREFRSHQRNRVCMHTANSTPQDPHNQYEFVLLEVRNERMDKFLSEFSIAHTFFMVFLLLNDVLLNEREFLCVPLFY